jgi:hypothetical protein
LFGGGVGVRSASLTIPRLPKMKQQKTKGYHKITTSILFISVVFNPSGREENSMLYETRIYRPNSIGRIQNKHSS